MNFRLIVRHSVWIVCGLFLSTCKAPTDAPTTGSISGTILDASSSQPISGAMVTTDPITSSKTTDSEGAYTMDGVKPGTFTVQASKTDYQTNTTIVNVVVGEAASADIQLTPQGPELAVATTLLNFGTSSTSLTFTISNTGVGTLTWNIISNANWVTVNPASGSTETETDVVTVTVNRTGMSYGNHYETITVTSNTNSKTIDILMTIQNPNQPQLSVSPITLDFSVSATQMSFYITNSGTGMLTWNITDDKAWISADPQSGTTETETDEIVVTLDRLGHSPGTYTGTITASSDGGNENITVAMTVPDKPTLSIIPTSLDFSTSETMLSFDVANAGSGDLTWSVTDNQEWITPSPISGTNYSSVNVSVSRNGLSTGDYSGTVTVSSNGGTGDVSVLMNVPADLPPAAVQLYEPTDIAANAMTLSWEMSTETDFLSYKLYRDTTGTVSESSPMVTSSTNRYTTEYTDEDLFSSKVYYYRLYVEDQAQQTTGSNAVSGTTAYALGPWSVVTTLGDKDLVSVYALDDNLAYAVGDSGTLAKWNGSSWSMEQSPSTNDIKDIVILASDNVWMVGTDGVFYYNGSIWIQPEGSPQVSLGIIALIDTNNIFVGSDNSADVYRYNSNIWQLTNLPGTISDLDIISNDRVYALVDGAYAIYKFNGIGWSILTTYPLRISYTQSIRVFSDDNLWITSDYGYYAWDYSVRHWDGSIWSSHIDSHSSRALDIDGHSTDNIWTCTFSGRSGVGDYFWHWDGTEWTRYTAPTELTLRKLHMYSSTDGWAVGDGGVILRYH
ncbi:MAG: carboxypeptidase regulatory-like domain-containing protein [Candidatus Marinimicrobia bacterium]|nr:carboxypeptidase regulatory-like domain-containing protein [Candidatus Neomarinimicrobiota bacterium]